MKSGKTLFILALALLAGCPMGDYFPLFRASLSVVDDKVCIFIKPEDNEKISSLYISDANTGKTLLLESDLALKVSAGECIPDYGFIYELGKPYHYSVTVESESKRRAGKRDFYRRFGASFTLRNNNGELEFSTPDADRCESNSHGSADEDAVRVGESSVWRKECLISY